MAEVTGYGLSSVLFCMESLGTAYARRCLVGDAPLVLEMKAIDGSIRSTRLGRGKIDIFLKADREKAVTIGFHKGCVRGSGSVNLIFNLGVKGKGCVKSFISSSTSKEAFAIGYGQSVGSKLSPIYTTTNLNILISNWSLFIPEIAQPVYSKCTMEQFSKQKHIEIEVMKEYLGSDEFKGDRRNWLVARINFKCRPVMYVLNMGWPGVYSPMKFVLDATAYQHLIHYLFTLIKPDRGGESTYRYSIDGTVLDRIRRLQYEPLPDASRLPESIKELINIFGDYDPLIRNRVYGVNQ